MNRYKKEVLQTLLREFAEDDETEWFFARWVSIQAHACDDLDVHEIPTASEVGRHLEQNRELDFSTVEKRTPPGGPPYMWRLREDPQNGGDGEEER